MPTRFALIPLLSAFSLACTEEGMELPDLAPTPAPPLEATCSRTDPIDLEGATYSSIEAEDESAVITGGRDCDDFGMGPRFEQCFPITPIVARDCDAPIAHAEVFVVPPNIDDRVGAVIGGRHVFIGYSGTSALWMGDGDNLTPLADARASEGPGRSVYVRTPQDLRRYEDGEATVLFDRPASVDLTSDPEGTLLVTEGGLDALTPEGPKRLVEGYELLWVRHRPKNGAHWFCGGPFSNEWSDWFRVRGGELIDRHHLEDVGCGTGGVWGDEEGLLVASESRLLHLRGDRMTVVLEGLRGRVDADPIEEGWLVRERNLATDETWLYAYDGRAARLLLESDGFSGYVSHVGDRRALIGVQWDAGIVQYGFENGAGEFAMTRWPDRLAPPYLQFGQLDQRGRLWLLVREPAGTALFSVDDEGRRRHLSDGDWPRIIEVGDQTLVAIDGENQGLYRMDGATLTRLDGAVESAWIPFSAAPDLLIGRTDQNESRLLRLEPDGSVTVLVEGLSGLRVLQDGSGLDRLAFIRDEAHGLLERDGRDVRVVTEGWSALRVLEADADSAPLGDTVWGFGASREVAQGLELLLCKAGVRCYQTVIEGATGAMIPRVTQRGWASGMVVDADEQPSLWRAHLE